MNYPPFQQPPLANYTDEQQLFAGLLQAQCARRILIFRGGSGMGKTTLLRTCLQQVPSHVDHVPFDLKSDFPVAEVFERVADQIGHEHFPRYQRQVNTLGQRLEFADFEQTGSGNRIDVYTLLNTGSPEERQDRRVTLTSEWFSDLRSLPRPLLISLDTFNQDKGSTELKDWLAGPFLARAARLTQLRILLAGQHPPEPNTEWGHCCELRDLYGVGEAQAWLPVLEQMQRATPPELEPLSYLAGICYACKGHPHLIRQAIEGLPHREHRL